MRGTRTQQQLNCQLHIRSVWATPKANLNVNQMPQHREISTYNVAGEKSDPIRSQKYESEGEISHACTGK